MRRRHPNIFSIPPGKPFLDTLVEALFAGELIDGFPDPGDPLSLARATILLPTRRACRALLDSFAKRGGPALLLPRIRAIGDEDEDIALFEASSDVGESAIDIAPAISPLLRRTILMRLILAWDGRRRAGLASAQTALQGSDAAFLAGELARLMDLMATQDVPWSQIDAILPAQLQEHWQVAYDFLELARSDWPRCLAALGRIDPATRRRLVMEAELAHLGRAPDRPVIAAGSTGSIPATAKLLSAIARLPQGAVVLPGLDRYLSGDIWRQIAGTEDQHPIASHPQASLRQFLGSARLDHEGAIKHLTDGLAPELDARERLFSRVMWPAEATGAWNLDPPPGALLDAALAKVSLIEAANEEEEGLAIALLLREGLEQPGMTIGLITPDRALGRRVAAELQRFGLVIDDTAGTPLSEIPLGRLARLVAAVAESAFSPIPLLALLKHPAARLGLAPSDLRQARVTLERAALRGLNPGPGVAGLRDALFAPSGTFAKEGRDAAEIERAAFLLERIAAAFAPLTALHDDAAPVPLSQLAQAHEAVMAALLEGGEVEAAQAPLLEQFFAELQDTQDSGLFLAPADYAGAIEALMRDQPVHGAAQGDPRLKIYGLLEARLARPRRLVLAGLNEGVWPATARTDAWLSRGMRAAIALPAPEQRIGLAAHDFTQGLGAEEVFLTRSLKSGTAPAVPSRWLQRLKAVIGAERYGALGEKSAAILQMARRIDQPDAPPRACERPAPRPPLSLRPRSLSVTEIETLIRDPYAIYAKHVLRLSPLEEIGETIDARERGTLIHSCIEEISKALAADPAASRGHLLAIAAAEFAHHAAFPQVGAFWWPRFRRVLDWFLAFDAERRREAAMILIEASGKLSFPAPGGPFLLRGRADRLEFGEGGARIIDFKTGALPEQREVNTGFAPQLPLEAAMVMRGGFQMPDDARPAIAQLVLVKLSGGTPAAEVREIKAAGQDLDGLAQEAFAGLQHLIARFDEEMTAYPSLSHLKAAPRHSDYLHLARLGEWGVAGGEGGE